MYAKGAHPVSHFLDCRYNPDNHQWDVLVKWIGLDDTENSWKPANVLWKDLPTLLRNWVTAEPKAIELQTSIGIETLSR